MISHIIKVAKRCWEIKSLNSGLAIVSALTSASIFRLSNTWSKVSKISLDEFETVKAWFSHKSNWSSLRSVVASTCPESTCCVPFLGFFIHDIIFIKESQEPMFGGGGGGGGGGSGPGAAEKVNLSRCRLLERVVDSALKFQKAKLVVAQKTNWGVERVSDG
ncbi:ras guanine nucleotide exchange factor domain-containing protein [Obelidium mucronatum]|nr:ras guanine nucleotide exchange factor domain-containing protein [Obelidium mucronatum]